MKYSELILLLFIPVSGCVSEYIPGLKENEEVLVVEGLITDQPGPNTISIYRTLPIWTRDFRKPVNQCYVWLTDDLGNIDSLRKVKESKYETDSATFTGIPGRVYTLHFTSLEAEGLHHYESLPMEMIPVPPIDTIYYEKRDFTYLHLPAEGCQIYLNTYDPTSVCKFYRWDYTETWEIRLPFPDAINRTCWASVFSKYKVMIKNTSLLEVDRVEHFPVHLITNPVDRLGIKYCLLVNQYSLNEDEYKYWKKLQNSMEQVGGLYDIIPASIPGNIYCLENNLEKVLGYFSVSAVKSKRLFITDHFIGRNGMYYDCIDSISHSVNGMEPWAGNNINWWLLYDFIDSVPPWRVLTNKRECGDCTSRGSNIRPIFWDDDKSGNSGKENQYQSH